MEIKLKCTSVEKSQFYTNSFNYKATFQELNKEDEVDYCGCSMTIEGLRKNPPKVGTTYTLELKEYETKD